jgi:hypothetical protein
MWLALLLNAELIEQSTDEPPTITIVPTVSAPRVHGIQFNVEPLEMASLLTLYDTFPAGQSPYT